MYWGQGPNQKSLSVACDDDIDIAIISFLTASSDEAGSFGLPGTNFGNACGANYVYPNGTSTNLLINCDQIQAGITHCQSLGKPVLLSIGGGGSPDFSLQAANAQSFADTLWEIFGPVVPGSTLPRPFGTAVIDGFDFDIENVPAPSAAQEAAYSTLAQRLRANFAQDPSKTYYLSAAPQCVIPDANLGTLIGNTALDFLFVQFYNTAGCSARDMYNSLIGNGGSLAPFLNWNTIADNNIGGSTKLFLGLPAAEAAASAGFYLAPEELATLIAAIRSATNFGGVSLWEATYAQNNIICNLDYTEWTKAILNGESASQVSAAIAACSATSTTTTRTTSVPTTAPTTVTLPSYSATPSFSVIVTGVLPSGFITKTNYPALPSHHVGTAHKKPKCGGPSRENWVF
ncbi:glycoside hydrolase superfamily [Xylariales sp. PMI_506]|nr:glycoside hydrolase superfamily [Xylariales sp. PMI_506]